MMPVQHAAKCGGSTLLAGATIALDVSGSLELFDLALGSQALEATINSTSIATAQGTFIVANVQAREIRIAADATDVKKYIIGDAKETVQEAGLDMALREKSPWWSYAPVGSSIHATQSAYTACTGAGD